jgi:hypothetical protein
LLTMEEQDRTLWSQELIDAGLVSLAKARSCGRPPGFYRWQAQIAALHATARIPDATDWAQIVLAYDALLALRPSPVVALNRQSRSASATGRTLASPRWIRPSRTRGSCPPCEPICWGASAEQPRPGRPMSMRLSVLEPTPSEGSCGAGWQRSPNRLPELEDAIDVESPRS